MPKFENKKQNLPFEDFMEQLKIQGFILGVNHYLRLQAIINQFGPESTPDDLKYLLCPIFATNKKQQEQFYRVFDRYFHLLKLSDDSGPGFKELKSKPEEKKSPKPLTLKKWPYFAFSLLCLIIIALAIRHFVKPSEIKPPGKVVEKIPIEKGKVERRPDLRETIPLSIGPVPDLNFYQQYWPVLRGMAVSLPLIILFFTFLYKRKHRAWAIQKQYGKKPPYIWPIKVEPPRPGFLTHTRFYSAANRLRQRIESDVLRLDVNKTIETTINKAGFPQFCYQAATKPPEYLFLVDLPEYADHYSHFMKTMADALVQEGIFVRCFFYADDPQVCFEEPGGHRFYLSDLQSKFSGRRLILAGTGDALLDPMTGRPEPWTELFHTWEQRAVLTTRNAEEWGMKEIALAKDFIVLPANLEGLNALVMYFEKPVKYDLRAWKNTGFQVPMISAHDLNNADKLENRLNDESIFQWVCACAVYPEINWSLTLYLGMLQKKPVSENALLTLIQLPWFKTGTMPDDLRLELISRLDKEKLAVIRQAVYDVLEKDSPPEDSEAWEAYCLNLGVLKWMISPEKRKYLKEIKENEQRIIRDYTLLRLLDSAPKSMLSLVIPENLHDLFFRHGMALFGFRKGVWACMAVVLAVAGFLVFAKPDLPAVTAGKSLTLEFAHIPAGEFMMGSPESEPGRYKGEEKLHKVKLTKGFYMQKTEVTQAQWKAVMGSNPSNFKDCDNCPVENVSWEDVQEFIKQLNQREGAEKYSLPTEAQWEYACRAGSRTPYSWGNEAACEKMMYENDVGSSEDKCVEYVKKQGLKSDSTAQVKNYAPNDWGLYDMHGNVWEWCEDWYGDYTFEAIDKAVVDPVGPSKGGNRVIRGGGWDSGARDCRSAVRSRSGPGYRNDYLGFRLLRSYP
ncbi:formylglycine-generating enzyme family protein [Desulfobacterales bacterium HSG17]|nr:formylglycine-generating enzyme family protein [Desulfobacterales bacterium HSG17]